MRTYSGKKEELEREWYIVDAEGQTLGRLASRIAPNLRGKHKPTYTPHLDCGDYVVVVNAEKVRVTGRKLEQKAYYRHSGYPGPKILPGGRTDNIRHSRRTVVRRRNTEADPNSHCRDYRQRGRPYRLLQIHDPPASNTPSPPHGSGSWCCAGSHRWTLSRSCHHSHRHTPNSHHRTGSGSRSHRQASTTGGGS